MGRIYNGPDWAPARPAVVRPGITTFRVVGLALGCLILAMSGESRVSAQTDESKVLALPLSAGAIASLVEYTNSEAAQARLAEALTSSLSGLRAAAARVLFVTARHSLLPAVSTALDRETDVDALAEEARALAWFGGPDADAHVLAAWQRVPADRAVLAIAAARGTAALEHLPLIRERTSDETLLAAYLRLACRQDPDSLTVVARTAIRRVDRTLLTAALRAWHEASASVPADVLIDGLRSASPSPLIDVVFWHLLQHWQDMSADYRNSLGDDVLAAIDRRDDMALDPSARVAYELMGRAFDRDPRQDETWLAGLEQPVAELERYLFLRAIVSRLTDRERTILARAYDVNRREFEAATMVTVGQEPTEPASLYIASGYPAGFMESVMTTNNCKSRTFVSGQFNAGGAQISLRADGRVSRLSLIDTGVPRACAAAARTLMMTFVSPIEVVVPEGTLSLLMVPFSKQFVTCQDSSLGPHLSIEMSAIRNAQHRPVVVSLTSPKPTYTMSTMAARVEGEVRLSAMVSPQGCVRSASVVQRLDPQLDWSAAWTATGFTFKPTGVDGDVRINLYLDFNMR